VQYALLFYNPPDTLERLTPAEREAWLAQMGAWREELVRAGVFRSGLRLAPADTARSLRGRDGAVLVHDGPFAETKEILGGLVTVECADLDAALSFARRCPVVHGGTVEVRPEFHAH
jgi:hypothetical protein